MFYGIMWFDARGIRPVPPPAGPGRGGGGAGRGLAAGGALTWTSALKGAWGGGGRVGERGKGKGAWAAQGPGARRPGRRRYSARPVHRCHARPQTKAAHF